MPSIRAQGQIVNSTHGSHRQVAIEVGKQSAAARDFPLQFRPQRVRIDAQEDEALLAASMFCRRGFNLLRTGKMNEAVSKVLRRTGIGPERLCRFPFVAAADVKYHVLIHYN